MRKYGLLVLLLGLFFNITETAYFGWNWVASSNAERVADWYSFRIVMLGIFMIMIGHLSWQKVRKRNGHRKCEGVDYGRVYPDH